MSRDMSVHDVARQNSPHRGAACAQKQVFGHTAMVSDAVMPLVSPVTVASCEA
jgi:hypothetical protein